MSPAAKQWLTLSLMVGISIFIIMSDVLLARTRGFDATYSRVMADLFNRYPVFMAIFIFGIGVFIGHVLLPTNAR